MQNSGLRIRNTLPPFTFRQIGVSFNELVALPGPGSRPLCAKTIRQGSFLGPGGQAVLAYKQDDSVVGAPGRAPERPASFCGKTIGATAGILFPPMLFTQKLLTPGPQLKLSGIVKLL